MGNPYTQVSVSGYNANPPADDGSQVEANRVKWSTIKTKLPDPLKTAIETIDANLALAFAKMIGGAGVTATATSYTVGSTDQGKLIRAHSASGIIITTPSATTVGAPFVFGVLNNTSTDVTVDGSGSETIDGAANMTLSAGTGVLIWTDGSNWFTTGQPYRQQITPQGYLTLTSLTPVTTADTPSAGSVFYTPDVGNLVPIWNGTVFIPTEFSELTLTLDSNHLANTLYDCFVFSDSGTLRVVTGPAWSSSAAGTSSRGSGAGTTNLSRVKGLLTNQVAMTGRNGSTTYSIGAGLATYVGTILIDGSAGLITCNRNFGQNRRWSVWNAYNRKKLYLLCGDATASWTYSTATIRASNNAAGNSVIIIRGLAEDAVTLDNRQNVSLSTTSVAATIGIGVNSTTATSGYAGSAQNVAAGALIASLSSHFVHPPALGRNDFTQLESGNGNATATFNGSQSSHQMRAEWLG